MKLLPKQKMSAVKIAKFHNLSESNRERIFRLAYPSGQGTQEPSATEGYPSHEIETFDHLSRDSTGRGSRKIAKKNRRSEYKAYAHTKSKGLRG